MTENVKQNLLVQLRHLESVLMHTGYQAKVEAAESECEIVYGGSSVYKDIMLLRFAGDLLDKNGSGLIRFKSEGLPSHCSPFIMAIPVSKSFVFELWCEKKKLLGDLEMAEAIAAFLHLSFVFNFEYPKVSDCLENIHYKNYFCLGSRNCWGYFTAEVCLLW